MISAYVISQNALSNPRKKMKFYGILHDGHIFEIDVFDDFKCVIHDLFQFSNGKNIEGIVIIV